jgi:phage-related protein
VFEAFVDGVKDFFGIHSPSTLFADFGGNIIQGMVDGIVGVGAGMWSAVSGVFEGLWDKIKGVFAGAFNLGQDIGNAIMSGADSLVSAAGAAVSGAAQGASNLVDTVAGVASMGYDMANQALKSTAAGAFVADTTQNVANAVTSGASSAASFVGNTASNVAESVGDFFGGWFANGTNFAPGGLSVVGEQGPELINLPRGSQVTPAHRTEQLLAGNNKSTVINANFHSPKAMNQMEQMRALKDFERELAFQGVL